MFIFWDWLGIISYFCIHYWLSKIRSGIKAVIYNKIGDVLFIFIIGLYYDSFVLSCYGDMMVIYYYWLYVSIISIYYDLIYMGGVICLSIICIMYSKSAQLPFFSWIENAILAPTPISSLLHSSTMVISGVYIGLCVIFMLELWMMKIWLLWVLIIGFIVIGCICVLIKGFILSDIKSIIAYSTISQISYMFIILFILGVVVIYHIIIHGVFKSMIFILCGCIIHVNNNFQCLYMIWYGNILIKMLIVMGCLVLCGGLSKEGIIYYVLILNRVYWVYYMIGCNSLLTVLYSMGMLLVLLEDRMIEWNGKMNWEGMEDGGMVVYILGYYGLSCLMVDYVYNIMFWLGGMIGGSGDGVFNGGMLLLWDEWSIDYLLCIIIVGYVWVGWIDWNILYFSLNNGIYCSMLYYGMNYSILYYGINMGLIILYYRMMDLYYYGWYVWYCGVSILYYLVGYIMDVLYNNGIYDYVGMLYYGCKYYIKMYWNIILWYYYGMYLLCSSIYYGWLLWLVLVLYGLYCMVLDWLLDCSILLLNYSSINYSILLLNYSSINYGMVLIMVYCIILYCCLIMVYCIILYYRRMDCNVLYYSRMDRVYCSGMDNNVLYYSRMIGWMDCIILCNKDNLNYSMEYYYRYGWWSGMGWWCGVGWLCMMVGLVEFV